MQITTRCAVLVGQLPSTACFTSPLRFKHMLTFHASKCLHPVTAFILLQILGVSYTAGTDEIKRAYRRMAKVCWSGGWATGADALGVLCCCMLLLAPACLR